MYAVLYSLGSSLSAAIARCTKAVFEIEDDAEEEELCDHVPKT